MNAKLAPRGDKIVMHGGNPLSGKIKISGSKNASLAIMPAALLTSECVKLTNVPDLVDIRTMLSLLTSLGVEVSKDKDTISLSSHHSNANKTLAHYDIVRKMRAGILVLGALLARFGEAQVSLPGGCAIGARPVDIHIEGLANMGVDFDFKNGYIHAKVRNKLRGGRFRLPKVSVGATANIIMAATIAKGETLLENAAREPEIVDMVQCLRKMGAHIEGEGTSSVMIQGTDSLGTVEHNILADRIELGSYMIAPAVIGGDIELTGGKKWLLEDLVEKMEEANVSIHETPDGLRVSRIDKDIYPLHITTAPYPGFPTDLQAQMTVMMALAKGTSSIEEKIFENRFMHVSELQRLGANIRIENRCAFVTGIERFHGASVMATDLRASISLILAGLQAEGETVISDVYHLDRGYESPESKLSACGAHIYRVHGNQ